MSARSLLMDWHAANRWTKGLAELRAIKKHPGYTKDVHMAREYTSREEYNAIQADDLVINEGGGRLPLF